MGRSVMHEACQAADESLRKVSRYREVRYLIRTVLNVVGIRCGSLGLRCIKAGQDVRVSEKRWDKRRPTAAEKFDELAKQFEDIITCRFDSSESRC